MDYKELEDLGYSPLEIEELDKLGIAELVVSSHFSLELEQPEQDAAAPAWATACVALFSALLLTAPWAGVIVEGYQGIQKAYTEEAHRSTLREAFKGNEDYVEYEWSPVPENKSYKPESGCLVHKYARKSSWNCIPGTEWNEQVNRWIDELPDE